MPSLGRDLASEIIVVDALGAQGGAQATNAGTAVDLTTLAARPESVLAVVLATANLDNATTLTIDQIKLQSSTTSNFATPVDRVTASDLVLTGAALNTQYRGAVTLALDLTQLPESHKYIRLSVRSALSDAVNTAGAVTGAFVFGGLSKA